MPFSLKTPFSRLPQPAPLEKLIPLADTHTRRAHAIPLALNIRQRSSVIPLELVHEVTHHDCWGRCNSGCTSQHAFPRSKLTIAVHQYRSPRRECLVDERPAPREDGDEVLGLALARAPRFLVRALIAARTHPRLCNVHRHILELGREPGVDEPRF